MCLSTAYKNNRDSGEILMRNVMSIACKPGEVILKDLMERELVVPGILQEASLVDGYVVIEEVHDERI